MQLEKALASRFDCRLVFSSPYNSSLPNHHGPGSDTELPPQDVLF
jgi:hypothetical protein